MSRRLVFLPEVSRDFVQGFNYYEALSPSRGGERFEQAFRFALRKVEDGTTTHARIFEHFHRVFVPRFPYCLYYRLSDDAAVIAAVLYARLEPARIQATLNKRR